MISSISSGELNKNSGLETTLKIWQDTFDAISDGVWILDPDGMIIQSNGVYERLLGIKTKDAVGQFCHKIVHCTDDFIEKCPFKRMKQLGLREYLEYEDKERGLWLQITVDPIRDRSGSILNAVHIVSDITERKKAERSLQESEERYRRLVELSPDAIAIHSEGKIVFCNTAGAKLLGALGTEELIGKSTIDFVHPDYRGLVKERARQMREQGSAVPLTQEKFIRIDGSVIDVEVAAMPFIYEKKPGIQVIFRDITERKKAEEKIREQAALLDHAQDAIAVRDLEQRIIYWNKGAECLYGWTSKEVKGKNANELLYRGATLKLIEAQIIVMEQGEWIGELTQINKDGKEIIVESRWTLVRDIEGKPKSILIINTDISEKKNLEAQLLRAQRLESIGTLASGIAHDFNNILTPIMLSVQILKERFNDEESQKLIDIIDRSSQRGAGLVKQVQAFGLGVQGERVILRITDIISEIKKITKQTFPKSIEFITNVPDDIPTISGDATQMHQVLMNLCVNARDAMPDAGIINISAENIFIDEKYTCLNIEARVGQYIVISVSDTGNGIPPDIINRIFEPFFTTKQPGKGTGLGLSTVLAIVKSHGGFINVYSEEGVGTTFKVYLPAIRTNGTQKVDELQDIPIGKGEWILIVDDEAPIREITSSALETHGYKVISANDGAQAISIYLENREKISAVIMDMMMPVMEGPASISALRKINPDLKIIAVSGLTESDKISKIATSVQAFLPKPYTTEKILKTVHNVLNGK